MDVSVGDQSMREIDEILLPISITQVMVNFAVGHGIDKRACLSGTGITEESLSEPGGFITRSQEIALVENLLPSIPDGTAFGFRMGLTYTLASFGNWGFALRASRSLREAVLWSFKYLPLSTAYCAMSVVDDGAYFGIDFDPKDVPDHLKEFFLERDIGVCVSLFNEMSLGGGSDYEIEFRGPALPHANEIALYAHVEPKYRCSRNALLVTSSDADLTLPTFDANMVNMFDAHCESELKKRAASGVAGSVRRHLLTDVGLVANIDDVARSLAMSPRSLRRKLDQEGVSFRALVEEERCRIATQLLKGTDMPIEEIAIHLGYTEASSFSRAFRRWLGCTPGDFRTQDRQHQ